ncbi:MAG: retropepsin-like domain-containing protein [Candidatus Eremiobacteraeota bacterium]|nr:retropepsin-like domain-containing protein [Candidatus Eremiobacteraeota bacterium]MBV8281031.1 retropepsin-like domain-containing protein [Candidatus Eremiobacteraeota bacterium]
MMAVWIGGVSAALMLAAVSPAPTASPSGPPSAVRNAQLDDLLDRHRRALGHLAGPGASWTGIVSQNGTDTPFSESADVHGHWRAEFMSPFGPQRDGDTDTMRWVQDVNGNVIVRPLEGKRSLMSRLVGFNSTLLDPDIEWTLDGPATVDGRAVTRLHAKIAGYDGVLYADARTALVYGVDIAGRSVRYLQYQTFDGLSVPTKTVDATQDQSITTTLTSVTFAPLASMDFEPPPQRQAAFPAGISDVNIDFTSPLGLIVIDAKVNGTPVKFLLDSGSSASLIDADEARALKLPMAGSTRVAGAKLLQGTLARADALEIAGVHFAPFVFEAVPLGLPGQIRGFGITGILGYDVLAQVVARIDYGRSRLRLISPDKFSYSGTGVVLTLDESSRVPHVPATLGDSDPATFTIDTGSNSGLIVYSDFALAHQKDFMRPGDLASETFVDPRSTQQPDPSMFFGDLTQASGAGGSIRVKTSYVSRLNLGHFAVDRVFTEIVLQPTGAFTPSTSDGLLGAAVLSKFGAVFLDYSGGRFILER